LLVEVQIPQARDAPEAHTDCEDRNGPEPEEGRANQRSP
jgi:hypothetical protein